MTRSDEWYVFSEATGSPFVRKCLVERIGDVYQIRRDPELGFDETGPEVMSREEAVDWMRRRRPFDQFNVTLFAYELLLVRVRESR